MSLPWVRLDTGFPDNPKILKLVSTGRHKAVVVYVASLAWSGRQETAGVIPKAALPFLHGTRRDAEHLVGARLWDEAENGWRIHDFDEYQIVTVSQEHRINAAKVAACKRWHSQPCDKCSPVDAEAS